MSFKPELNEFVCDRCGAGVGNGSISKCVIVSDVQVDDGWEGVRTLHFGRACGCAKKLLSKRNLAWLLGNVPVRAGE